MNQAYPTYCYTPCASLQQKTWLLYQLQGTDIHLYAKRRARPIWRLVFRVVILATGAVCAKPLSVAPDLELLILWQCYGKKFVSMLNVVGMLVFMVTACMLQGGFAADIALNQWSFERPIPYEPGARFGSSMVTLDNVAIIHGGFTIVSSPSSESFGRCLNDTWALRVYTRY